MQKLLERNNFYASFTNLNKARIANVFSNNGWRLRKSSWTDFELKTDWSELVLEGEEEKPLMNGIFIYNETNINKLNETLTMLEGLFVYEIYDESENLIFRNEKHL